MTKEFNIVIVGTGGQGLITLLQVISEAARFQGYDVKTSELHGLSQRGGSVEVQIRFGKKIFSPLVQQKGADLIIALELQESLKSCYYADKKTTFLLNDLLVPVPESKLLDKKYIFNNLKKFSHKLILVPGSDICEKEIGNKVAAGIFILSLASSEDLIPLPSKYILKAIKKIIPEKYLELNLKTFYLAKNISN